METKTKRKIKNFIITIAIMLLITQAYSVGRFHGRVQGTMHALKFEEACNTGRNTEYINGTCHLSNTKFTNKYQFNDYLIIYGNQSKTTEKIDMFLISGKWIKEIEE